MRPIPTGTFQLGLGSRGHATPAPPHVVEVTAFLIDANLVTVAAYDRCVRAGACVAEPHESDASCNGGKAERACDPMNCVDWFQATAFCQWLGKRLPSEAEWEYAARGTDGRVYPWGDAEPSNQLCWKRSREEGTCPINMFPRGDSPFGVHDMAGNVQEWVSTPYSVEYGSGVIKPGEYGTRGGSFVTGAAWSREPVSVASSVFRGSYFARLRAPNLGFRCAK
jgi:formylglycine-generating enzyme required for sulfatase activity